MRRLLSLRFVVVSLACIASAHCGSRTGLDGPSGGPGPVAAPCDGVVCRTPPSACYRSDGVCVAGACSYAPADGAACDDGDACTTGDVCSGGACGGKPVTCAEPPEPTCTSGSTRRVFASPGTCTRGACAYPSTDTPCPSGCAEGSCSAAPPSPPPPTPTVTAGAVHTCAVTSGGAVLCWGDGTVGELGNGSTTSSLVPAGVVGMSSGARAASAGSAFSCGIDAMGAVLCWGLGAGGELGDGTSHSEHAPVAVAGLSSGARAVSAGQGHACAVTGTGALVCWGDNTAGQLGDGSTLSSTTPVGVTGDSGGVVAVASGGAHTCALLGTGALQCWGQNASGQVGDGSTVSRSVPVVVDLPPVLAVSAGASHTCAVTSAGAIKCWGLNDAGQLGDGSTVNRDAPVDVVGASSGFVAVAAGEGHTCGLTSSGGVACWGRNEFGQLGTGDTTDSLVPVMSRAFGIASISTGHEHTCAVTTAGRMQCWGFNGDGELGDGTTIDRAAPVDVLGP